MKVKVSQGLGHKTRSHQNENSGTGGKCMKVKVK